MAELAAHSQPPNYGSGGPSRGTGPTRLTRETPRATSTPLLAGSPSTAATRGTGPALHGLTSPVPASGPPGPSQRRRRRLSRKPPALTPAGTPSPTPTQEARSLGAGHWRSGAWRSRHDLEQGPASVVPAWLSHRRGRARGRHSHRLRRTVHRPQGDLGVRVSCQRPGEQQGRAGQGPGRPERPRRQPPRARGRPKAGPGRDGQARRPSPARKPT